MLSPGTAFDLRASLSEEIRGAMLEIAEADAKPKAVHRCRVHLKRARALARVGRAVAPGLSAVFNESARGIMHSLAQARDLSALADSARAIGKRGSKKQRKALNDMSDALDAARVALPPINLDAARAGLRDLLALAQVWPESSSRQIEKGAERIARRARRACKRGHRKHVATRRHEWRKREKDRLYAETLLGASWPVDRKRRRSCGEKLADVLGDERDALLLIERLGNDVGLAGGKKPAARAMKVLKQRCEQLCQRADRIGAELHADGA